MLLEERNWNLGISRINDSRYPITIFFDFAKSAFIHTTDWGVANLYTNTCALIHVTIKLFLVILIIEIIIWHRTIFSHVFPLSFPFLHYTILCCE